MMACFPGFGRAEDAQAELLKRFGMRVDGGVAFFLSRDQLDWLGFKRPGVLADLSFSMVVQPWLSAELGGTIGIFMSGGKAEELKELAPVVEAPGGLLAPWLGLRAHGTTRRLVPFLSLSFGPGFTGDLVRPLLQGSVGADINVGLGTSIGPVLGFTQLFQKNTPGASTDALCFWVGLTFAYRALPEAPPTVRTLHTHSVERVIEVRHVVEHDIQREEIYIPAPPAPPVDNKELDELLDRALPAPPGRVELLAPVLFAFDSDALQPPGVAMLHEVADVLKRRTEIELVAIQGYADKRGTEEHNRALKKRRAERVRSWLIERGIAAERLMVAAGEDEWVEHGESEPEQAQNRRVVFRVLRVVEAP
jgi:outer membrane protein OmpA-like peptidoglycan-associated protein